MTARGRVPAADVARGAEVLVRDYLAVRAGESVLVTADTATDPLLVQELLTALERAGAPGSALTIPRLPYQGALADPYVPPTVAGAASAADVWIDVTFPYLAGSHVSDAALGRGQVRYLLGGDMGAAGLARLLAGVDLDAYYALHRAFDEISAAAIGRPVRITDAHGSDVAFTLAKPAFTKPRRAERPGLYFVPGSCTMFPDPESVRGTLAIVAAFHEYYTRLPEPITLVVDGRIREVRGDAAERVVLERALRRAAGGETYGHVIHFTHGVHPAARVTGESFIEDMRATGNNAVGLGIPFWLPGGGENHPDAILSGQSLWIDGKEIARDGVIVGPPELAALAERLVPAVPSPSCRASSLASGSR
jgi:leucyl aminopeptidase (aminopeptidase T)